MDEFEKPSILFVDDDADVLAGLRQTLRRERKRWDLRFANSGAEGLEAIAERAPDIVVTDMRMPGMNGVEFLERVVVAAPEALRFVLSGEASETLSVQAIPVTHQWMTKPCARETLVDAIARSLAVASHLANTPGLELVAGTRNLPTAPAAYRRLLAAMQDSNADLDEIADSVGSDLALTARVLQLTNSSYFGLRQKVERVRDAVSTLGLRLLSNLVLASEVFKEWGEGLEESQRSPDRLMRHAEAVIPLARGIAESFEVDVDASMTSALLHDIGALLLGHLDPTMLRRLDASHGEESWCAAERRELGFTHAQLGGALLQSWGLPIPVVEAVTYHHAPAESGATSFDHVAVVHVANALASNEPIDWVFVEGLGQRERLERWIEARDTSSAEEAA